MPSPLPVQPPDADALREISREGLSHLAALAEATPVGARGAAAMVGILLMLAGARVYRLAIAAPGFLAGVAISAPLLEGYDETSRTIGVVVAGLIGGFLTGYLEQVAVRLSGVLIGAFAVSAGWPLVQSGPAPLWVPLIGAGVGLLLFPSLYRSLLKIITPLLGAMAVAWAIGAPENLILVAGLTAVGALVQFGSAKKG